MSPACTAANYVKVHAFLARGTCLFFSPRRLVSLYFCLFSFSSFTLFLLSAALLLASFIFHSCRPYHSLQVARIISPVEYHIRPRLRARSFGSTKRDIIAMHYYRSEREISYLSPRCSATGEFAREQASDFAFSREFSNAAIRYSIWRTLCKE